MSNTDRLIRILVALTVGGLYFTNTITGGLAIVLGVIAGIFLITGFVSFCPLYKVLGIKSA